MNLHNVQLVYAREMRDQLRDRRTLFLIAVLPLLLYPLLGMSFFQLSQFLHHEAAKVLVVGEEGLADRDWLPRLMHEEYFDAAWFRTPEEQQMLQLVREPTTENGEEDQPLKSPEEQFEEARSALERGEVQAVLYFPSGFAERLDAARELLLRREQVVESELEAELPQPEILYKSANEKSRVAQLRVDAVVRNWRNAIAQTNLRDSNVPVDATAPFEVKQQDVSQVRQRQAAVWSKILPFILFIWALTGAFYPAIDLCAGEKERGTLETLLVSPAERREIVWGKLLTIMSFSVVTALLNLASMGLTAKFVLAQFQEIATLGGADALSLPPIASVGWLILALIPMAAFFSALCLACAAFARSTKEGQYYLMPLLLVIMPLMLLPMSPGVELNLGNSLIPVTGLVLLLRSMIEGQYWQALPYIVPVVGVMLMCCLLAIRWAEDQFNREGVLFRESERLDLGRWLNHLIRDRRDTPTLAQAILCVALIMIVQFFVNLAISARGAGEQDFRFLVQMVFISQVVVIALPAALMTLLFTRKPLQTLMLDRLPRASHLAAAAMLALVLVPWGQQLSVWIQQLYPYSPEVEDQVTVMSKMILAAGNWWMPLLLLALLPALCEEVAFRGFILSGMRHLGHKWWAIGLSAIAFGMAHFFLQQKISATVLGLVIGFIAVQSSSLVPCIVFHTLYNSINLLAARFAEQLANAQAENAALGLVFRTEAETIFRPWLLGATAIIAIALLWWFHQIPYQRTDEERLQETRDKQLVRA